MESFLAVVAALINLITVAVYHDKQAEVLNSTAAALCLVVAIIAHFRRRRSDA
jgi:phosphate starvation-inducible membrane PsiE